MQQKQEFSSKNTSINSTKNPSVVGFVEKINGWISGSINLDVGGGKFDNMTHYLFEKHGVTNLIFDPYNRTDTHNKYVESVINDRKADTATISNVLCVIKEDSIKLDIIKKAFLSIKDDGVTYITNYEGNKSGQGNMTRLDQWQENKRQEYYLDLVMKVFPYVVKKGAVIIATKKCI